MEDDNMCKWNQLIIPRFNYNGFIVVAWGTTACNGQLSKAHTCSSLVHPLYGVASLLAWRQVKGQEHSKGTTWQHLFQQVCRYFLGLWDTYVLHERHTFNESQWKYFTFIISLRLFGQLTGAFQKTASKVRLAQFSMSLSWFVEVFGEDWKSCFWWEWWGDFSPCRFN